MSERWRVAVKWSGEVSAGSAAEARLLARACLPNEAIDALPAESSESRSAEICRRHFIGGESLARLARDYFLTIERIESILAPVRAMRDVPEIRAILAQLEEER